jgi:hypothetical protein
MRQSMTIRQMNCERVKPREAGPGNVEKDGSNSRFPYERLREKTLSISNETCESGATHAGY